MKQFTVVKNEKGELNLDRLKALEGTRKASPQTTKQAPEAKPMPIQIDLMRLKIGKVAYVDYSNGKPATKEFLINLDQSYQNITDLNSVVRLIVLKAMMSSGISNLTNFNTAALEGGLVNILATGKGTAGKVAAQGLKVLMATAQNPGQTAGDAGTTLQNTLGMLGHTGKSAGGTVTNVASALKKKIRIPF